MDPYCFPGSDFGICIAQKQETFENQALVIVDVKKISALINDWENNIVYGKNSSKARPFGCWQVRFI